MKTKNLFYSVLVVSALVIAFSLGGCKKDKTTENTTPSKVYLLSKDSTASTGSNYVKKYYYNSSKKLVKINYYYLGTLSQFDTLIYNTDGTVQKVNSYNVYLPTIPYETKTYTFTSGNITTVVETGTNNNGSYSRTRTFTYSASYPQTMTVVYSSGAGEGNPENFTDMVYTNGNITSAHLTGYGPVVATTDLTAANPYLGMNVETDQIDVLFNKNNMTQARLDTLTNEVFFTRTFTYANGRLATIHSVENSSTYDTWLTYQEY